MSARLLQRLSHERVATAGFIELLEQEAQAMISGDFTALPALAQRKSECAAQIALLIHQREAEQLAMGYSADGAGAQALSAAWAGLRESAALAREHNHRNGVMIHTHLDFTRRSISFLQVRGQAMYGPDGSHQAGAATGNRLAVG